MAFDLHYLYPRLTYVDCRGHSSSSHTSAISGRHCNDDRVDVRLSVNQTTQDPSSPMTARLGQDFQCNQTRQNSPLRDSADEEAIVDFFREIREPEQIDDEKAISRDAKKVGLEGCEASTLEV